MKAPLSGKQDSVSVFIHFNSIGLALDVRKMETEEEDPRYLSCPSMRHLKLGVGEIDANLSS